MSMLIAVERLVLVARDVANKPCHFYGVREGAHSSYGASDLRHVNSRIVWKIARRSG